MEGETPTAGTASGSSSEIEGMEVLTGWTRGQDGKAMDALLEGFRQQHPDTEFTLNSLPGNIRTVLRKRILNDNAPSTFQNWPGRALAPYAEADLLGDIESDVWDENGMKDAYQPGVIETAQVDGSFVAVPLNIHRINPVFYNVNIIEQAGIDPASMSEPADLTTAMEAVERETDAAGMAQSMTGSWTTLQLWETILLAEGGVDAYQSFTSGEFSAIEDSIRAALQQTEEYEGYFTEDAKSIEWPAAARKVINGKAGFMHHGDWAAGVFLSVEDLAYGEDWDWIALPGTEDSYALVLDSFVYPEPNKTPEATKKFLRYVGTADAQERFNPVKGSIPPRTDVSKEPFSEYQRDQIESFKKSDAQPPSVAHGLALPPEPTTSLKTAFGNFTENWDTDAAISEIQRILE
jgi:glucose/mannose transport system substrate-binding protein